ncbi:MAG: aldose 1-epimerase family protein [Clostridia bacterium]|nr:aldose 1-epimerase family protein [Clostridia bacterium]
MNKYIGCEQQIYGVEESRLVGGRGDGMRLFNVRNGKGLEFTVSADRCADISRLSFKGDNFGYFAPCGYVAPQYYDGVGTGFLKSFTAGFFTTCGLNGVGSPCVDEGEEVPLHGTISNTPCENIGHWVADDGIHIKAIIRDASLFGRQLLMEREYICSLEKNEVCLTDKIINIGSQDTPVEILYHCNMGYPLLSENSEVKVPSENVVPRNEHAADGLENCLVMHEPVCGYEEKCYFHEMHGDVEVSIFNKDIDKGLVMAYNADELEYFTEWKMLGEREYVLGLEPGNCHPDGRAKMRSEGKLLILKPGEEKVYKLKFTFIEK